MSIGELTSYLAGILGSRALGTRGAAFQRMLERGGWKPPVLIFFAAFTPFPDDILLIPLGMGRYSLRRLMPPLIAGKVAMGLVLSYGGYYSVDIIRAAYGATGWWGILASAVALLGIVLFIVFLDWELLLERGRVRFGIWWRKPKLAQESL